MSLVTGLLNRTCTIKRPVMVDDGAGGETLGSLAVVGALVPCRFRPKTSQLFQADGGRVSVQGYTMFFEWMDEALLNVNDVVTDLADQEGNVVTDVVGDVSTPAAWKVTARNDPGGEGDHLEVMIEAFHGRAEGQP